MIFVYALVSVVVCVALEWAGAASSIRVFSLLPLGSLAVLWWMDRMSIIPRLIFVVSVGFLLDSVLPHPFGVHIAVFLLLAGVTEFLHALFSARDSRVARLMSAAVTLVLFFILFSVVSRMI